MIISVIQASLLPPVSIQRPLLAWSGPKEICNFHHKDSTVRPVDNMKSVIPDYDWNIFGVRVSPLLTEGCI